MTSAQVVFSFFIYTELKREIRMRRLTSCVEEMYRRRFNQVNSLDLCDLETSENNCDKSSFRYFGPNAKMYESTVYEAVGPGHMTGQALLTSRPCSGMEEALKWTKTGAV